MAKLTRSGLVYGVMNANATLPMEEVLQLIVDADAKSGLPGKACDLKRAKAYYVDAVKKGLADGVGPTKTARAPRTAKAAAPKAAPAEVIMQYSADLRKFIMEAEVRVPISSWTCWPATGRFPSWTMRW